MVHEKKVCPRCQREIDAFSRICPFCNFEQHLARDSGSGAAKIPLNFPPPAAETGSRIVVEPPLGRRLLGSRVLMIIGGILVLVAAFAVGAFVNRLGSRDRATSSSRTRVATATAPDTPVPRSSVAADLRLVPVEAAAGEAITSAPLAELDSTLPAEAQRTDATALPSTEYSKILADARAAPPPPQSAVIDPRSLPPGLGALQQPRPASTPRPVQRPADVQPTPAAPADTQERTEVRAGRRTQPVPTSQPIPNIRNLREGGTVRLRLTISPAGRVTDVQILEGLTGATPQVIASVQRWRFKPATLDGDPVQGTFDVDISFNASR